MDRGTSPIAPSLFHLTPNNVPTTLSLMFDSSTQSSGEIPLVQAPLASITYTEHPAFETFVDDSPPSPDSLPSPPLPPAPGQPRRHTLQANRSMAPSSSTNTAYTGRPAQLDRLLPVISSEYAHSVPRQSPNSAEAQSVPGPLLTTTFAAPNPPDLIHVFADGRTTKRKRTMANGLATAPPMSMELRSLLEKKATEMEERRRLERVNAGNSRQSIWDGLRHYECPSALSRLQPTFTDQSASLSPRTEVICSDSGYPSNTRSIQSFAERDASLTAETFASLGEGSISSESRINLEEEQKNIDGFLLTEQDY